MPNRRLFTPQFKAQVVLELLNGEKSQAKLCREYQLSPYLLTTWKDAFLANAPTVFSQGQGSTQDKAADAQRIAELSLGYLTPAEFEDNGSQERGRQAV